MNLWIPLSTLLACYNLRIQGEMSRVLPRQHLGLPYQTGIAILAQLFTVCLVLRINVSGMLLIHKDISQGRRTLFGNGRKRSKTLVGSFWLQLALFGSSQLLLALVGSLLALDGSFTLVGSFSSSWRPFRDPYKFPPV